jgi:hypothetical protein
MRNLNSNVRRAIVTACLSLLILPAAAEAARTQETIVRDDAALAGWDDSRRFKALTDLHQLGVDTVHHIVGWRSMAPRATWRKRPSVDLSDPAAYAQRHWNRIDALVRGATEHGLDVIIAPAGPAPRWATDCNIRTRQRAVCKPDPREFQRFVIALARRYSGSYRDAGGRLLPRVDRWSIWNEPNQGGWLQPQWQRKRGRWSPVAGYYYRRLLEAGIRGLRKNGHARDQIMMGETAPLGRRTGAPYKRSTAPLTFWRAVLCLDSRGRRLRGRAARNLGCKRRKKLDADAVSHHPYTRGAGRDPRSKRGVRRNDVTLANHRRLRKLFDRGARLKRNAHRIAFYITEYGLQTNPPDRRAGVRPSLAAKWLNESNWMAYNNARIKAFGNYQVFDEANLGAFQTGLRYKGGRAKPSYKAFRMPIWVLKRRKYYRVWGQVRPAQRGQTVDIEYQARPRRAWKRMKTVRITNPARYIDVKVRKRARKWRLVWRAPGGERFTSRQAFAEKR